MKKAKRATNMYFYAQLPSPHPSATDFPSDIEIQHAYDEPIEHRGLSAKQVSLIANDTLGPSDRPRGQGSPGKDSTNPSQRP